MKHFASKKLLMGALLVSVSLLLSVQASAQKKNVTLSANQITVANLIKEVEKQTDYLFVYNEKDVNLGQTVSVNANNESAVSVLSKALAGTGVTPKVEGTNIVLSKTNATAENKAITGTILDENGEPVVGASVLVKGTTNGVSTDFDGKFSINAPANAVLVCSSIGFVPQEIAVAGKSNINVALASDTELLDDVVVIGYGTAKKRDYIGSVSTIKADDVMKTNPTSVESALQGMAAGVQVNSAVGVPGAPQQIKIRGVSSLSCATDPLWIVDGIPVQSGAMDTSYDGETQQSVIGMLNPNDIESIQVLKDAAATAIYGSRASNGVIIVKTKSGQKGNVKVNVDLKGGLSSWAHSDIGLANTSEWFQIADQAIANTLKQKYDVALTLGQLDYIVNPITTDQAKQVNTNWVDQISRTGSFYEANVSVSGGTDKMKSYASFKYRKDNGNLKFNDLTTFAGNVKLDWNLCKWFDLSYRLAASYTDNNRIKSSDGKGGAGGWAQINSNALPWFKAYADEENGIFWNPKSSVNPRASLDPANMVSNLKTLNLISNLGATIKLPVDGLSIKGDWGVNYINSDGQSWKNADVMSTTDLSIARENRSTIIINNLDAYLSYAKTFNKNHDVSAVLGVEGMRRGTQRTILTGTELVGQFKEVGTPRKLTGTSGYTGETYLLSYFFRANYKLMDRYIVNFSARRDGSSKFTEENRWANFFSGALGWVISEEPWFNSRTINLLKLRGSVGQVGNSNLPGDVTTDSWEVVNENGNTLEGLSTSRLYALGNPSLKWETTTSYDAGVDFGLFNNRLNGSVAYYRRNVTDMLTKVSLPMSSGIRGGNFGWQNIGDMFNQGVELELMGTIMQRKNFTWTAGFNIATNMNKVTKLDPDRDNSHSGILNLGDASECRTIIKTGLAYGTYYMAEYAGVDAQKGIPMIYEIKTNEDGLTEHTGNIIPATSTNIDNNKMILQGKSALPTLVGGFNTTLKFYGFDVSAVFSFATGQYVYSRLIQSSFTPNAGMLVMNKRLLTESWQKPGDNASMPQINAQCSYFYDDAGNPTTEPVLYGSENKTPTSRFLEKADYLKLRTLTIGYSLPAKVLANAKIQNVRFYLSGGNLFTITPFSGYDPEVAIDQMTGGAVETFAAMPSVRTYTFGVNLNF